MSVEIAERVKSKDLEVERPSIGVALVIVGIDPSRNGENASVPKIWTILEKKSKPETEKTAGQISFPGETRKIGESLSSNIIGALAELTGNDFVIENKLFILPSSNVEKRISIRNNPVDLVVLVYDGSLQDSFQPVDQEDVAGHRWMTIAEIKEFMQEDPEGVRKFARDIVSLGESEQMIRTVVQEYMHEPLKRLPISVFFPPEFSSIAQFNGDREKMVDTRVFDKKPN